MIKWLDLMTVNTLDRTKLLSSNIELVFFKQLRILF